MDPTLKDILDLVGSIGAPAVTVILSMKYAINGMREDVKEIKEAVIGIKERQEEHSIQIAVLDARSKQDAA